MELLEEELFHFPFPFNIYDPYAKLCVPDVVKNINPKVFILMSRTNKTRHIQWHETYWYKSRLDASVCYNKQRWNEDKCRLEFKELIDKDVYDKGVFGIQVIVNVNVINHVILVSIFILWKTVNVERN